MRISDWSSDVCSSDLSRSSCNLPYLGALQPPVIAFQKSRSSCNPFRHMLTLTSVIAFQKSRSSCNTFEQKAMGSEVIAFQKSRSSCNPLDDGAELPLRSEETPSELQSLMRHSYAVS